MVQVNNTPQCLWYCVVGCSNQITVKGGFSKSRDTGKIHFEDAVQKNTNEDEDLGAGYIFGLSVGQYITNNLRLELEASQRGDLEFNSAPSGATPGFE